MTDLELLRQYGRHNSQDAFATVVARHLNLVYSAARRQVRSAELAEDVVQAVFVELSRQALQLPDGTHVAGWLHVAARRRAIDTVRREARRAEREQAAAEFTAMNAPSPHWSEVEPCLDQALHSLRAADRQAILLRFFENQTLRQIGQALGISDDSAQKRLSRALERLRASLARRGITTTAAALATDLATQGVQAAPSGLAAAVSAAVATSGGPLAGGALAGLRLSLTDWLGRHGAQIGVTAAAVTILIAVGQFARSEQQQLPLLESRHAALVRLQAERDQARLGAAGRRALPSPVAAAPLSDIERRIRELLARVALLHDALDRVPGARTPELALLEEKDWLLAAQQSWNASADDGIHHGLGYLQLYAKYRLAPRLSAALHQYLSANGEQPPANALVLAPYFSPPIDPAILSRFAVTSTPGSNGAAPRVRLREAVPNFDNDGDRILEAGNNTWALIPVGKLPGELSASIPPAYQSAAYLAALAYGRAHNGDAPPRLEDLKPYFADPMVAEQMFAARDGANAGDNLTPEEQNVARSVQQAVKAYQNAHQGAEPTSFVALAPYFRTPEEADKFRQMAQRHGKVLP